MTLVPTSRCPAPAGYWRRSAAVGDAPPAHPHWAGSGGVMEPAADATAIDFSSLRFLVVDDDPDQRYLLTRTLAGMGTARVVEAPTGHEALALLADVALRAPSVIDGECAGRVGDAEGAAASRAAAGENDGVAQIVIAATLIVERTDRAAELTHHDDERLVEDLHVREIGEQ